MQHVWGVPRMMLVLLSLYSMTTKAEKINGIGLSQSSAGTEFNLSIATANARQFIVEQTTQSVFQYKKSNHHYEIKKEIKGVVNNIKNKEVIYLDRYGVAVIVQAEVILPSFSDEICTASKYKIKSAAELSKMIPSMLKESVIRLAETKFRDKNTFSGLSYIKNLNIFKWRRKGRYTIHASVCLAKIKQTED